MKTARATTDSRPATGLDTARTPAPGARPPPASGHDGHHPLGALVLRVLAFWVYYSGLIALLRHLGRGYAKILLYHSVGDEESVFLRGTDVWISSTRFERHLRYVSKYYRVLSLEDLTASGRRWAACWRWR